MVYVVNEEVAGCIENHAVHFSGYSFSLFECGSGGVAGVSSSVSLPFVPVQSLEIFGVDDCVFALGEQYPAEGVAITDATIQ